MKININNLSKAIRGVTVLDNITLEFDGGKIYGLSGKNGSGKTMLMRAICGLIKPGKGEVLIDNKILGKDFSFPKSIGVLIENPAFIEKYTGFKNLKILASIQNKIDDNQIKAVLSSVGLDPNDKRTYKKYSLGMKQRLGIACAVMENPDIILLDEPINALDESGVKLIKKLLLNIKNKDRIIIVSCHDKDELEFLSDEIFVLSEGKLIDHKILNKKVEP